MNKSRFIELIWDPNKVLEKDLIQLTELAGQYPYCQVLHILRAKGSKKLNQKHSLKDLHLAAIYSADRTVLKTVMEETAAEPGMTVIEETSKPAANFDWIEQESTTAPVEEPSSELSKKASMDTPSDEEVSDLDNEQVNKDLEQQAEVPFKSITGSEPLSDETAVDIPDEDTGASSQVWEELQHLKRTTEEIEPPGQKEDSQTTAATEEDAGEPVDAGITEEIEENEASRETLDLHITADLHEKSIHEELMDNLSKLKENRQQFRENPDFQTDTANHDDTGDSKKEQIEIIDNFIKNSPLLSKPDLSADSEATSQKDLSKKSAVFHDDMASEQLAKILMKQGNKKDAIKIYEKLIRKFPEKKSYFAGQIENISKK